jgi:hypothetical protein
MASQLTSATPAGGSSKPDLDRSADGTTATRDRAVRTFIRCWAGLGPGQAFGEDARAADVEVF